MRFTKNTNLNLVNFARERNVSVSRLEIAHSIKTLENILGEIEYTESKDNIKEIINDEINKLREVMYGHKI